MPLANIPQPELLPAAPWLRLRRYDGVHGFALPWYQDAGTVLLVDGAPEPYTREKLDRMYAYLDAYGELFFIEALEDGAWVPIGDVTLCPADLPIVIGEQRYRKKGVGRAVVRCLIERARALGWDRLHVREIYPYNHGSQRLFSSLGFQESGETAKGRGYTLLL